ncbi:MAG: cupin domain-containing protein [Gammaproteobacteria bacterium]
MPVESDNIRTIRRGYPDDELSGLLANLRLHAEQLIVADVDPPWCYRQPRAARTVYYYRMRKGCAVLELDGTARRVLLGRGDIVMLPHGSAHRIGDGHTAPARRAVFDTPPADEDVQVLYAAGSGAAVCFSGGSYTIEAELARGLVRLLPPVMHLRSDSGEPPRWSDNLTVLTHPPGEAAPAYKLGLRALVMRAAEYFFIQVIREYFSRRQMTTEVFGHIARHPGISALLPKIRARPGADWSIERMARAAGLSRTRFIGTFHEVTGVTPAQYVIAQRMAVACELLKDPACSVGSVAYRVGYTSDAAFARLFKRRFGVSPAAFRQAAIETAAEARRGASAAR